MEESAAGLTTSRSTYSTPSTSSTTSTSLTSTTAQSTSSLTNYRRYDLANELQAVRSGHLMASTSQQRRFTKEYNQLLHQLIWLEGGSFVVKQVAFGGTCFADLLIQLYVFLLARLYASFVSSLHLEVVSLPSGQEC
jgi:hypothetical protein